MTIAKFRISSNFPQIASIVSCFRKYHSKVLKHLSYSKSRKVRKSPFWLPDAAENGRELGIFFSLVQINAMISINILWVAHSASLTVPKALI